MARVLVVEDDIVNGKFVQACLERAGFQVDFADGPEKAIEKYAEAPFDLVLTDLHMPAMSGLELIEKLQQSHPQVTAMMLTGEEDVGIVVSALKLGVMDYLVKPAQEDELVHRAARIIELAALRHKAAIAEKEREIRFERQLSWNLWKEDVLSRDRDRFNKSLLDNLRVSFSQGMGIGGLVTMASMLAATPKSEDGSHHVPGPLMELLERNAAMAEKALERFETIDLLMRNPIDLAPATPADLHALVTRLTADMEETFALKRQSAMVSEAPRAAGLTAMVSANLLENAFRELLLNAMKYSEEGAAIYILFRISGSSLIVSVMNPACEMGGFMGIPEEAQRIIFEPFFRLVRTVDERYGTLDYGLGLPYVEKIIQRHNARISVAMVKDFYSRTGGELVNFELQLPVQHG
jgi:DNA-binding response OmpR family regulator